MFTSYPCTGPDWSRSSPLPCGTPSTTSTRTTSASSLSAMRTAQFAPTLPAPTTVTFFRKTASFTLGEFPTDYSVAPNPGLTPFSGAPCRKMAVCPRVAHGSRLPHQPGVLKIPKSVRLPSPIPVTIKSVADSSSSGITTKTILHTMLGRTRLLLIAGLLAMLVLFLALAWATRDALAELPFLRKQQASASRPASHESTQVDLRPWQTAHALAGIATTAEEKELGSQAERFADHEVDQAFASALRYANLERGSLTGEALALSHRVEQLQQVVNDDQAQVGSEERRVGKECRS